MGRPRGSKNKTKIATWEIYKPSSEIYDDLWRPPNAPPEISLRLPKQCPIPHSQSAILERRQTEDGLARNYYLVRVISHPENAAHTSSEPHETTYQVDASNILDYVSRRELERFEQADFAAVAHAEEVARKAEVSEYAQHMLGRNSRERGVGRGSRMVMGLGLDPTAPGRTKGRPRGRGRARGRGSGRGRGMNRGDIEVDVQELRRNADISMTWPVVEDKTEEAEGQDPISTIGLSPSQNRNSFLVNSALPSSPIAAHRRLSAMLASRSIHENEHEDMEDFGSTSSAAAQLQLEEDMRGAHLSGSKVEDYGADRHRAKRQRTDSQSPSLHEQKPGPTSFRQTTLLANWVKRIGPIRSTSSISECSNDLEDGMNDAQSVMSDNVVTSTGHPIADQHDDHDNEMEQESEDGESEVYVVEAVLDHSDEGGQKFYLVKWEGYEDSTDWLPEENLLGAVELVAEYHQKLRQKRKGKRLGA